MFEMSYCISANTSYTNILIEPTATRQRRAWDFLDIIVNKHSIKILNERLSAAVIIPLKYIWSSVSIDWS